MSLVLSVWYLIGLHIPAGGGKPFYHVFLYQFCHHNIWHLLANLYCLWLIAVSNYRVSARHCILSYIVSAVLVIDGPQTQGLSGVLYCLVGMLSWQAAHIRRFHAWMIPLLLLGVLFPSRINVLLHIFCYISGILIEMHFIPWRERLTRFWR